MTLSKKELEALLRGNAGFSEDIRREAELIVEEPAVQPAPETPQQNPEPPQPETAPKKRRRVRLNKNSEEKEAAPEPMPEPEEPIMPEVRTPTLLSSIADKQLEKLDPVALMAVDYLLKAVYDNKKFKTETEKILMASGFNGRKDIKYISTAAELATILKANETDLNDIQGVLMTVLNYRSRPAAKQFTEEVLKRNIGTEYTTRLLDYVLNYAQSGSTNRDSVLELMKRAHRMGNYTELETLSTILESDHRQEIIALLRKFGRMTSSQITELTKLADVNADAEALAYAKDVAIRRNPRLPIGSYMALEAIVTDIKQYNRNEFSVSNRNLDLILDKSTSLDFIKEYANRYIKNVDEALLTCNDGSYAMFAKEKQGCNDCKERGSCGKRNNAKEVKGLLRGIIAIVDSAENRGRES